MLIMPTTPQATEPEPTWCGHWNEDHHQCEPQRDPQNDDCRCDGKCNKCACTGCPAPEYGIGAVA